MFKKLFKKLVPLIIGVALVGVVGVIAISALQKKQAVATASSSESQNFSELQQKHSELIGVLQKCEEGLGKDFGSKKFTAESIVCEEKLQSRIFFLRAKKQNCSNQINLLISQNTEISKNIESCHGELAFRDDNNPKERESLQAEIKVCEQKLSSRKLDEIQSLTLSPDLDEKKMIPKPISNSELRERLTKCNNRIEERISESAESYAEYLAQVEKLRGLKEALLRCEIQRLPASVDADDIIKNLGITKYSHKKDINAATQYLSDKYNRFKPFTECKIAKVPTGPTSPSDTYQVGEEMFQQ